jgi:Cytochrome c oxidase assembly protein CtaG/Cox11
MIRPLKRFSAAVRVYCAAKTKMKPLPHILAAILLLAPGLISAADQRHVRIHIRLSLPNAGDLSVVLSRSEVVVQPGDLFEVSLSIKNQSKQPVNARIDHVIEPPQVAQYLDLVECGFLVPVTLHPEIGQTYSGRYLLREKIPEGIHQLSVTYDFKLRRVIWAK